MYQISDLYSHFWKKDFKDFPGIAAETIICLFKFCFVGQFFQIL